MEGEQEKAKMRLAQDLMHKTVENVNKGTVGSTPHVAETLGNVGQVLQTGAEKAPDRKSEKAISDMAKLVEATEQLVIEKDIGDRVQKIAREAELAAMEQERVAKPTISSGTARSVITHAQSLANNFGPLFQLIISSYEFRCLVLDFVKIAREVFLRTVNEDVGTRVEKEWLHGRDPAEIAKEAADKTVDQLKTAEGKIEIPVSDEEIDTLQDDLLAVFTVISRDPRYRDGISKLFELGEILYEESEPVAAKAQQMLSQPHTHKLQEETKQLISEFTGRDTLERFIERFRTMVKHLQEDQETQNYLKDLKNFVLETKDTEYVRSEEFKKRTRELVERGRRLTDQLRYKPEIEPFLDAANELIDKLKDDELVSMLRERAGILMDDLTYEDAKGNRQIDVDVLSSIRKAIVPILADALKYIPIPRIEDSNYKRDYIVENVVLCGYDIIPENIYVHLESDSWVNVRELETQRSRTRLVISLRNFRTEIKDVSFYYKRKTFPKLEEAGRASLRIGGNGATLVLTFLVEQRLGDSAAKFTGSSVNFHIEDLDIEFDKATLSHEVLVPMITVLFKRDIIHFIERGVEKNLGRLVNEVGSRLSQSMVGSENRFAKQLELMTEGVKNGEFSRKYRKRQEKLQEQKEAEVHQ